MSDGRKPKLKEQDADLPRMKVELKEEPPLTAEQIYLKRKAEVTQQDNERFSEYLREKAARDEAKTAQPPPTAQHVLPQRRFLRYRFQGDQSRSGPRGRGEEQDGENRFHGVPTTIKGICRVATTGPSLPSATGRTTIRTIWGPFITAASGEAVNTTTLRSVRGA